MVDTGVVVTGADPEAVADGVVALPAGKGGMIVEEVDTGIGATTVGVVAGVVATVVEVELADEVVGGVEVEELEEELDEELVEVKDAVAALWVPLALSHA